MPERAPLVVLGICAVAVVAVALTALGDDRRLAFTLGVRPASVVATLTRVDEVCQRPIDVPASADRIRLTAALPQRTTAPLRVRVRTAAGARDQGRVLALGGRPVAVEVPVSVREGERVEVCVRSHARGPVGLYGGPDGAAPGSALYARGGRLPADLALEFVRAEPRSALSLVPAMLDRAALFNAGWVAPWLLWALMAMLATAVPALLAVAVRRALREPDQQTDRRP